MAKQHGDLSSSGRAIAIRHVTKFLATIVVVFWGSRSDAGLLEYLPATSLPLRHITAPMLPPSGYTRFCQQHPDDCKVHSIDFRRRNIKLTPERWGVLNAINREVNHEIRPKIAAGNNTIAEWHIAPDSGDCTDYAVTKRHQLLALGWPSSALLLAEVILPSGEHHLVLVVRMVDIDLVLDNVEPNVRMAVMAYRWWVRIETSQNPNLWARLQ